MKNKNLKNILKYASLLFTIAMFSLLIISACGDDPVTPEDRAPEIKKIDPLEDVLTRDVGDNINFKAEGSDPDGDEYSVKGRLDGLEVPLIIDGDMASYLFNIIDKGNYTFEMIVENTEADTVKWLIDVDNSKPIVSNVILLPIVPTFQDTAKLSFDKYDADGDSLTEVIKWYVNNSLVQEGGKIFPLDNTNYSNIIKATVQVHDGKSYSDLETSNLRRMPSQPDPAWELTHGLYDDFDGHGGEQGYDGSQLAIAGGLSSSLWRPDPRGSTTVVDLESITGDSVSYGANPSGNVVKMVNNFGGDMRSELINPEDIDFADYQSFSADVMLNDMGKEECGIGLDYHTSIPEQPPGISWYTQIGILKDPRAEKTYVFANVKNKNTGYQSWSQLEDVNLDTWYNLRMDIIKIDENNIEIQFYVNDDLKTVVNPPDSEILLDPSRLAFGPKRSFTTDATTLIDNIKAVYRNRIQ